MRYFVYFPAADGVGPGYYTNDAECDYKPPLEGSGQITDTPIINTRRTVCYNQLLCDDDTRVEGDEAFSLMIVIVSTSVPNVVTDNELKTATIVIVDNDSELLVSLEYIIGRWPWGYGSVLSIIIIITYCEQVMCIAVSLNVYTNYYHFSQIVVLISLSS